MAEEFEYKIVKKNDVSIITFKGKISKDSKEKLSVLQEELSSEKNNITIFHFKDVPTIDAIAFREISLIQLEARKNAGQVFLTGINSALKNYLNERGVIRLNEVRGSLEEALKAICV